MWKYIDEFKNIHKGHDIYVIGSGPSLQYYSQSFFQNKICIGINYAHKFVQCEYAVCKDIVTQRGFDEHITAVQPAKFITTEFFTDLTNGQLIPHIYESEIEYYLCKIAPNTGTLDLKYLGTDTMIQSHMTVTTVINIAYYMGAANIILIGIDLGLLDDKSNRDGYYVDPKPEQQLHFKKAYSHPYAEVDLIRLRNALKKLGCNVVSCSPFIGMGHEGHRFTKFEIPKEEMWRGEYKVE